MGVVIFFSCDTIARGQFSLTFSWYFPDTYRLLYLIKACGPGVNWTPRPAATENFDFYVFMRLFSTYLWLQISAINKSEMLLKFFLKAFIKIFFPDRHSSFFLTFLWKSEIPWHFWFPDSLEDYKGLVLVSLV